MRALLLAAAVVCFPTVAQQDGTYFTLHSMKTFAPGGAPQVQLSGYGLSRLQFRLYRVNDPVRFFEQLPEPRHFGGEARRAPRDRTALERYHAWKNRTRSWMRDVVRAQFSDDSRHTIRLARAQREQQKLARFTAPTAATEYAQVPLLNPQQVLSVWEQQFGGGTRWQSQTIPIAAREMGVYLLEATDGKVQAYTMVCLTNLVAIHKGLPGRLLTRVVERGTGKPVAGAEVILWANRKHTVQRTDAEGLAESAVTLAEPDSLSVMARHNGDFTPSAMSGWALSTDLQRNLSAYVYTDRPVYRPGHPVRFKAILRQNAPAGYLVPKQSFDVQVQDPEGNAVFRRTMTPSAMGSLTGELTLPQTAPLGFYSVEIKAGERYAGNGGFQVEEYRKPEYEVKVTPEVRRVTQGEAVRASIEARYYFGEPVPGAKVTYAVHRSRYWPPFYGDESAGEDEETDREGYGGDEQVLEEHGTLDAQGKLTITFPSEDMRYDLLYRIEARVTDTANREITGSGWAIATRGPFFLNISPGKYVYAAGERAQLAVESRDYDGNAAGGIPFTVDLLARRRGREDRVLRSAQGRTNERGQATVEMPVDSGSLIARVRAKGPSGKDVEDEAWLWAGGGGFDWGGRQQRVEIVPDKKSYRSGETARLLVVTGMPDAWVWVTTEGRALHESKLIQAKGQTLTVEVPVRAEYTPNFFVSAVFVRDGEYYQGTKSVRVPPVERQLSMSVSASKAQFKPGETGTFAIEVKDHLGKPAAAEVSLGVVDEAIYAIRREAAQDITRFFYGMAGNSVSTETSLHFSFYGSSGKRRMPLARIGGRVQAQLKPERFVDPRVRKAFPDTLYWAADLRTDAGGRASARVEFPDALTTWRATARGVTTDTKVGSALTKTIVRKNLIVRVGAPRFFTEGDEVTIPVVVQSYLSGEKTARVSLDAKGVEIIEGATRDVVVAPRGMAQVDFRVRAAKPGPVVLLGKALTDEESDALELTLPIRPFGVPESVAKAGSLADGQQEAQASLSFPADANPAGRALEIAMSPSLAGPVFGALEYLTTFPYGCTEQTMSSFLPNLVVAAAARELSLNARIDQAELAQKIRAGLDRLYDYQHEDGGWGWWKSDDSQAFMTAYVVAGLARAKAGGFNVRQNALDRGAEWLRQEVLKPDKKDVDLRAYLAYALAEAGSPHAALLDSVWQNRSSLTPYGLALLGLAVRAADPQRAGEIAALLESQATSDEHEAHWPIRRDGLLGIDTDATPEATAYALKFLVAQKPDSALLPKAALYLVNHRNEGYYWQSTKQTAMVVYGLTDYLKRTGELKPDFTATVFVDDKPVHTQRFQPSDALAANPSTVRLDPAQFDVRTARVRIARSGKGTLYWNARASYFSPATNRTQSGAASLAIGRQYFKLTPEKTGDRIVHRLDPLGDSVGRGDIVAVRLTLTGAAWRYLMVEDPIPAGMEFIERTDLYELKEKPSWWMGYVSRREFRDDRAALFLEWMPAGGSEQTYLLKVVNSGKFRVSAARVQPMYQPQNAATSDSRQQEVK